MVQRTKTMTCSLIIMNEMIMVKIREQLVVAVIKMDISLEKTIMTVKDNKRITVTLIMR